METIEKLPDLNNAKVLIVRVDKIGSILLATPFMRALREHYKSAQIDMLLASRQVQIMKYSKDIDNLYIYDKKSWFSFLSTLLQLRKNKYDYIILMSHVSKTGSNIIRFIPATKAKIIMANIKPFFHNVFDLQIQLPRQHTMQRYYEELASSQGLPIQSSKPILDFTDKEINTMEKKFPKTKKNRIIFFIGNLDLKKSGHRWQAPKYAELLQKTHAFIEEKDLNTEIILMAGAKDAPLLEDFKHLPNTMYTIYIGTNLHETAALLAKSELLVCGSTGPAHMAAAVECPVLSIVSPADHAGWAPYGEKNMAVIAKENSVLNISVEEVFSKVSEFLEKI